MSGIDRELTLEPEPVSLTNISSELKKPKANLKVKELSISLMIQKQWKESPQELS